MLLDTRPKMVLIKEVVRENEQVTTLVLDASVGAEPGQFVNVWIPSLNEKPFSVAMDDGKEMRLSVAAVGPFSNALCDKKVGEKIGVRGPFGTKFKFEEGEHLALLAGGYGAAPLYFLASEAAKKGCTVEFIVGARSKGFLLNVEKARELGVNVHVATDDGSEGSKGYNTEVLAKILDEGGIDCVYTVGPEVMMYKAAQMAKEKGVRAQISVERYMKCGMGLCGNCCLDGEGAPTCVKGPVMDLEKVLDSPEFGHYHRDQLGNKHNF